MARDIREANAPGPSMPVITTVPPGRPHSDYDDEVPSQRRLRRMTPVLAIPFLVGVLFCLAYALGYWTAALARAPAAAVPRLLGVAVLLALPVWLTLRGKVGSRRRWLNLLLLAASLVGGASLGWRAGSDASAPLVAGDS
jgi:hypothetical protein